MVILASKNEVLTELASPQEELLSLFHYRVLWMLFTSCRVGSSIVLNVFRLHDSNSLGPT